MEKKELGREDVIEALKEIAFGRVHRGVELTYLSEPTAQLIRKMDLSAVAEFKRNGNGTVEVKSIAREAGSRTKLAVWSADPNVDPIGACVGPRGQRVNTIVEELKGEKMDIIKYSDDPAEYIAAALSPADVISVEPLPDGKSCRVVVPDDQLSLAIGKEGQNARLAAKLTGYKIDIKPASAPLEPIEAPEEELFVEEAEAPAEDSAGTGETAPAEED